jgi:adenylate cyclase
MRSQLPAKLIEDTKLFHNALRLYRQQDWEGAERVLKELQSVQPDDYLYQLYLDRIAGFRTDPPGPDWDGVYTHETK